MTTITPTKEIRYDRETGDYALYLDGNPVGYARTQQEGETVLDELAYQQLTHPQCGTPAETDDLRDAALLQHCVCYATGIEQPECLARGRTCDHADTPPASVPTVVVVEPSPLIDQVRHVSIDRVALEDAYHAAIIRHPDATRGWGKAIKAAYEYLCDVWNDQGAVTFVGDVLLAESGSRPGVVHLANGSCSCEAGTAAREAGREVVCRHRATRQLVVRMLQAKAQREAGERQLAGRLAAARAQVVA
jgi:hypothetical protein